MERKRSHHCTNILIVWYNNIKLGKKAIQSMQSLWQLHLSKVTILVMNKHYCQMLSAIFWIWFLMERSSSTCHLTLHSTRESINLKKLGKKAIQSMQSLWQLHLSKVTILVMNKHYCQMLSAIFWIWFLMERSSSTCHLTLHSTRESINLKWLHFEQEIFLTNWV